MTTTPATCTSCWGSAKVIGGASLEFSDGNYFNQSFDLRVFDDGLERYLEANSARDADDAADELNGTGIRSGGGRAVAPLREHKMSDRLQAMKRAIAPREIELSIGPMLIKNRSSWRTWSWLSASPDAGEEDGRDAAHGRRGFKIGMLLRWPGHRRGRDGRAADPRASRSRRPKMHGLSDIPLTTRCSSSRRRTDRRRRRWPGFLETRSRW